MRHKKAAQRSIGLDLDATVIERWRTEQAGTCELHHVDATAFLKTFAFTGDELVYVDPPYMPETRRRAKVYRCDYTEDDHAHLLNCLVTLPCNVMISGYDSELYNRLLAGWRKVSFPAKTHADVREEVVWMNYEPTSRLHDSRYLGETFRDRQTIQRRQARLRSRIDSMNELRTTRAAAVDAGKLRHCRGGRLMQLGAIFIDHLVFNVELPKPDEEVIPGGVPWGL